MWNVYWGFLCANNNNHKGLISFYVFYLLIIICIHKFEFIIGKGMDDGFLVFPIIINKLRYQNSNSESDVLLSSNLLGIMSVV